MSKPLVVLDGPKLQAELIEASEKIEAQAKLIADLRSQIATLQSELDKQIADNAAALDLLAAAQTQIAQRDGVIAELNAKIQSVESAAAVRALEITAQQGVPPVQPEAPKSAVNPNDLHAQFLALTDHRERARFYALHRESLLGSGAGN